MINQRRNISSSDSVVQSLTKKWNKRAADFIEKQEVNPFSDRYTECKRRKWVKGSEEYAKPVGITAERGEKARSYISKQIDTLCQVIRMIGQLNEEGEIFTTFGELFQRYTRISDSVVGLLIRARKRHLVEFSGEMLWQRRDDDAVITLVLRRPTTDKSFKQEKIT